MTFLLSILFSFRLNAQLQRRYALTGNNIVEFVPDKDNGTTGMKIYYDPIDDTIHYKHVIDNIYKDRSDKIYILTTCNRPINSDTSVFYQYYKDVSDFINLKTYKSLSEGFFSNKGKVHYWAGNSDGEFPIEVLGADPKTFIPFKNVGGGKDSIHVFYGGYPDDFHIIPDADPKTIRVLNPERGCWNCGNCYFVDAHAVYFGLTKIKGADPKTFRLVNKETVDAVDKNNKYFDGKKIVDKKRP